MLRSHAGEKGRLGVLVMDTELDTDLKKEGAFKGRAFFITEDGNLWDGDCFVSKGVDFGTAGYVVTMRLDCYTGELTFWVASKGMWCLVLVDGFEVQVQHALNYHGGRAKNSRQVWELGANLCNRSRTLVPRPEQKGIAAPCASLHGPQPRQDALTHLCYLRSTRRALCGPVRAAGRGNGDVLRDHQDTPKGHQSRAVPIRPGHVRRKLVEFFKV
jgi:hypothetical protein